MSVAEMVVGGTCGGNLNKNLIRARHVCMLSNHAYTIISNDLLDFRDSTVRSSISGNQLLEQQAELHVNDDQVWAVRPAQSRLSCGYLRPVQRGGRWRHMRRGQNKYTIVYHHSSSTKNAFIF